MTTWILAISYWIHLLTTVVWLGGLTVMSLVALPAWRKQTLSNNQWVALQKGLSPWINVSMALIWISGFYQMTNDAQYSGFMVIDSSWAWAMLVKHVAVLAMTALTLFVSFRVHPAMDRLLLLEGRDSAETQRAQLLSQEQRLLRLNLLCSVIVLLCTAIATAL